MPSQQRNLGSVKTGRRIRLVSSPQLVAIIRRLQVEHIAYKLANNGQNPSTGPLLRAAMDEAKRRNITIQHPENLDEQHDSGENCENRSE